MTIVGSIAMGLVEAARPLQGLLSAAADASASAPTYRYSRPFLQPLPVWDYWPWLLLPLCVAVAVVYKSIKCRHMRQVPREATVLTIWIVAGMATAAAVLAVVVKLVEKAQS